MSDFFVKICGVTSPDDARLVRNGGANAVGCIVAASQRQVDAIAARKIFAAVEEALVTVMVVKGMSDAAIIDHALVAGPHVVQCHDPISMTLRDQLAGEGIGVWRALAVDASDFATYDDSRDEYTVVDGAQPGSGQTHSWDVLGSRTFHATILGAGGLNPDNVAETVREVPLGGVDVASGVESSPGIKDPARVLRFVQEARRGFEERAR